MVENNLIRMVLNFAFTLLSSALMLFVVRIMLGMALQPNWLDEAMRAGGNAAIGLVVFPLLDRLQIRD